MACTCGPKEACSQCPPTVNALAEQQRRVVKALQARLIHATDERRPSGDVKDIALALGCAVDKLSLLGGAPSGRGSGFYHNFGQSSGPAR